MKVTRLCGFLGTALAGVLLILCASCAIGYIYDLEAIKRAETARQPKAPVYPRLISLALETNPVTQGGLVPDFDSETFIYMVTMPDSVPVQGGGVEPLTVKLSAEGKDGAQVTFAPALEFAITTDSYIAVVYAVDSQGLKTPYYIQFERQSLNEQELVPAKLSGIDVSGGLSIDNFDPEQRSYEVHVPYGTHSVTVNGKGELVADGGGFVELTSYLSYRPGVTAVLSGGTADIEIGVTAPGRSLATYKVSFIEDPGADSMLSGISVSAGGFDPALGFTSTPVEFDPAVINAPGAPQKIYVPVGTNALIVSSIAKHYADSVVFGFAVPGAASEDGKTVEMRERNAGDGLGGVTFNITVDQGLGFAPSIYYFEIEASNQEAACLDALRVTASTGGGALLYSRKVDGSNSGTGSAEVTSGLDTNTRYNIEFNNRDNIDRNFTITIEAEKPGAVIQLSIDAAYGSGNTITRLSANMPPVQIRVSEIGKLTSSYWLYLVPQIRRQASLSNITVSGGVLMPKNGYGGDAGGFYDSITDYVIKGLPTSNALIVDAAVDNPEFTISYDPRSTLSAPLNGQTMTITVDGGADYGPKSYYIDVRVTDRQVPRLQSLIIDRDPLALVGGKEIRLADDKLLYNVAVSQGDDKVVDRVVPFQWKADTGNTGDVEDVSYSLDWGGTWASSATGFNGPLKLTAGGSGIVIIQVTCKDTSVDRYMIRVTRRSSAADYNIQLSYGYGNGTFTQEWNDPQASVGMPCFLAAGFRMADGATSPGVTLNLKASAPEAGKILLRAEAADDIDRELDGVTTYSISNWAAGDQVKLKVDIYTEFQIYDCTQILTLYLRPKATTPLMAKGGNSVEFIQNKNSRAWEELHTFTGSGGNLDMQAATRDYAPARVLLVGGGGGGAGGYNGVYNGGGGGGGGITETTVNLDKVSYTVTVGGGGGGGQCWHSGDTDNKPKNGGNGTASSIVRKDGTTTVLSVSAAGGNYGYADNQTNAPAQPIVNNYTTNGGNKNSGGGNYDGVGKWGYQGQPEGTRGGKPRKSYTAADSITGTALSFSGGGDAAGNGKNGRNGAANTGDGGSGNHDNGNKAGNGGSGIVYVRMQYVEPSK